MSWRIGLGNLLHHLEKAAVSPVAKPQTVSTIVRHSLAETNKHSLFIDGPQSPIFAVISKCMRTNHLDGRVKLCHTILQYFNTREKVFELTAAEKHLSRLFEANARIESDSSDITIDNAEIQAELERTCNESPAITYDDCVKAEAFYVIQHNWAAALHGFLITNRYAEQIKQNLPSPSVASPPLRLIQLWAQQNPKANWRLSLKVTSSISPCKRTSQHATAEKLLRTLGPLAWEMWNIHTGAFPKGLASSSRATNYAINVLPQWQDRWLAAFHAFDILTADKRRLNFDSIDLSQILWTKLGQYPLTPHLYVLAAARGLLQNPDPWRLASALRSVRPLEKLIHVFENVQCAPEIISFILLQLLSMYHLEKHRVRFTTIIAKDCLLECLFPQLKQKKSRDAALGWMVRELGMRMDGEPICLVAETRLFAGQKFSVDFSVIDKPKWPLYLTDDASRGTRCFFDANRTVTLSPNANIKFERAEVYLHTTVFNRSKEVADEGFRVIHFWNKPCAFFQPLPSETTLVKALMPHEARVDHPMAWNDQLPEEERRFEIVGVDVSGHPSLSVYAVIVRSFSAVPFDLRHQMLTIRKFFAANNIFILGDTDLSGAHMSTPLAEKPLIALKSQRFRNPVTGVKVLFETITPVDLCLQKIGLESAQRVIEIKVPM